MGGHEGIRRPSVRIQTVRHEATPDDEPGLGVKELAERVCNGCGQKVPEGGHDCSAITKKGDQ